MAKNQTISYLRDLLSQVGLEPDSRRGQNFLIDINLQHLLVEAADLGPEDVVLEVGTGTGALTELMAERAGAVVTVEVDKHLYELASELLYDYANVTMLLQDALRNKNNFAPEVLAAVKTAMDAGSGRQFKLAANLPYSIATPVLSNLLSSECTPVSMTATIQKELADRIVASPGNKDYGSLSIWVQAQCRAEVIRTLAPTVFWPRPKVTSAIVRIEVEPDRRAAISDRTYFHHFVRMIFVHRRKFLRANLVGAFKNHLDKPKIDQIMQDVGLSGNARSEELSVAAVLELCEAFRQRVPDWTI